MLERQFRHRPGPVPGSNHPCFSAGELDREALVKGATAPATAPAKPPSKKEQILSLYQSGLTDIAEITRHLGVRPSYVGEVLQQAGFISGYHDLYTSNSNPAQIQNLYARFFVRVLEYKTVEAAENSVAKINRLYNYFERLNDRAGQHHAMTVALTGFNRARWSGKQAQSRIFRDWLISHT